MKLLSLAEKQKALRAQAIKLCLQIAKAEKKIGYAVFLMLSESTTRW